MIVLMKYECGLKFTGLVFEDEETAEKYMKEHWINPKEVKLVPATGYSKNGEIK